jgi:dephospho-CoA kinase
LGGLPLGMVIGVTGGYCAGKSVVSAVLRKMGFSEIDVDEVGHAVLREKAAEVIRAFGEGIRAADGGVDRKKLGAIVYSDRKELSRLERIVHPEMVAKVKAALVSARGDALINAAILYKMGLDSLCDAVFRVTAPVPIRLIRAKRRDGVTLRHVLARLLSQRGIRLKSKGSAVDIYTVRNGGSLGSLERSVRSALERTKRGKAV